MNAIRNSVWSIVLLGLAAGCGGEPETAPAAPADGGAKANSPPPGGAPGVPTKPLAPPVSKPADTKKGDEPPAVEGPKAENTKSESKDAKLTADELAAIKELPATEQAAAIQQAVCPVSDHHLGSMEKPFKVSAEGRTFYLCCKGCEEDFKADPKGVIAKLDKK